jgi:hypothetical protein
LQEQASFFRKELTCKETPLQDEFVAKGGLLTGGITSEMHENSFTPIIAKIIALCGIPEETTMACSLFSQAGRS